MFSGLYLLLLLPAVPLAVEDFRSRRISVVWLGSMGVLAFVLAAEGVGWWLAFRHGAVNIALLGLLTGSLVLWLRLWHKPLRRLFRVWIGSGDLILMAVIAPLFSPESYVRFLLAACLAGLGWWLVKRPATIPLAGVMALTLAGYAICKTSGLWN